MRDSEHRVLYFGRPPRRRHDRREPAIRHHERFRAGAVKTSMCMSRTSRWKIPLRPLHRATVDSRRFISPGDARSSDDTYGPSRVSAGRPGRQCPHSDQPLGLTITYFARTRRGTTRRGRPNSARVWAPRDVTRRPTCHHSPDKSNCHAFVATRKVPEEVATCETHAGSDSSRSMWSPRPVQPSPGQSFTRGSMDILRRR